MPPKAKFTKEQITEAALSIVRENGLDFLTARTLGTYLGSSSCPIFTVFQNMKEVQLAVKHSARELYNSYIREGLTQLENEIPRCKIIGQQYIRFAIDEPKLFQLLFMKEQPYLISFENYFSDIDMNYEDILTAISNDYRLDYPNALKLYQHIWIYSHGIASLCATQMCSFTEDKISEMLSEVFVTLLNEAKTVTEKRIKDDF